MSNVYSTRAREIDLSQFRRPLRVPLCVNPTQLEISMSKDIETVQARDDARARARELTEQELLIVAGGYRGDRVTDPRMSYCGECFTRDGN